MLYPLDLLERNMKKTSFISIVSLIMIAGFLLTGCSMINTVKDYVSKKTKDYNQKTEKKYNEQIAKKDLHNNVECSDYVAMHWPKLIKALKEKDSDAIYELLCPYLQKEKGTKEKIQQMLDKIDGNIVSNDDPSEFGYSYLIDHPIPYYWEDDAIRNIKTDKGKVYSVDFEFYVFYQKNHDYEGIVQMSLYNSELPDTEHKIACIEDKKVMHELESTK